MTSLTDGLSGGMISIKSEEETTKMWVENKEKAEILAHGYFEKKRKSAEE